MNPTRPLVAPALFALAAACLVPAEAAAQGYGPDPFRPFNSQYDPYVFGVPAGPLDSVGNPTINRQGIRNANQFRESMENLDSLNRYDRAFRAHDVERGRVYRPNAEADRRGDERRARATELYFQYFNEKDPRKRAALFRDYKQARTDVARGLATDPNARGSRRTRPAGSIPPVPGVGNARDAAKDPGVPATPEGFTAPSTGPRARRSPRTSGIPPVPAGDDASPSEILDRASRPGRAAPAPPQAP